MMHQVFRTAPGDFIQFNIKVYIACRPLRLKEQYCLTDLLINAVRRPGNGDRMIADL